MAKIRSLKFNLKDIANELALNVIEGKMLPKDLVTKDASELASDKSKSDRKTVMDDHLAASRTDLGFEIAAANAKEGLFKCGKCKSLKTTFHQMQTRGADEPMTNFVTCLNCSHQWKC